MEPTSCSHHRAPSESKHIRIPQCIATPNVWLGSEVNKWMCGLEQTHSDLILMLRGRLTIKGRKSILFYPCAQSLPYIPSSALSVQKEVCMCTTVCAVKSSLLKFPRVPGQSCARLVITGARTAFPRLGLD